jgi:hypothetical protein
MERQHHVDATLQTSADDAGRFAAGRSWFDPRGLRYAGISLAVHAGLLAAMALFTPPFDGSDEDGISPDQQYLLQQYLQAAAEKEQAEEEIERFVDDQPGNEEGDTGASATEGARSDPTPRSTGHRYATKVPRETPDAHDCRRAALQDAASFGLIGLLNCGAGNDPRVPTAPWGREDRLGSDPLSAGGGLWGYNINDSAVMGGLGLCGVGEVGWAGCDCGARIGLGSLGAELGDGFAERYGHLGLLDQAHPPTVRAGTTQVRGRLPPEVIQRVVRRSFRHFRRCYEDGLRASPSLQGRVGVRCVVGRDGAVSSVGNGGSDLPDANVVSCVERAFYGLSFPPPESGIATVTYPIVFTPGAP